MPKKIKQVREPVELSIVSFHRDDKEDIFLTYTWDRSEGPDIRRTGKGPPYMGLIGGEPGDVTTHPFGLRLGTWLIREEMRELEKAEAQQNLDDAYKGNSTEGDIAVLEQTLNELETVSSHEKGFADAYPNHEIIGFQGCGDLTMNEWNVAYVNSCLAKGTRPALIHLPQEPLEQRLYSCLIKWKGDKDRPSRLTIQETRFNRLSCVSDTNELVWVRHDESWMPVGDLVEFAVSNQQVIREGNIVPVVTTCSQFGDLRHLLHMPNLNPKEPLYQSEIPKHPNSYRPRQYFNKNQFGDIWLGEENLLRDTSQNLLRTALFGPVFLDFPPDANEVILRSALERENYEEAPSSLEHLTPGKWRFVSRGPQVTVLEIFFRRNHYGWTMIGLGEDSRRIYCLACKGKPGITGGTVTTGYTVEEAAAFLLDLGVRNALLMDEGEDVMQLVKELDGGFTNMVPSRRRRLRALFIFAKPIPEAMQK